MSKQDFLLEIGVEELPARFVTSSIDQLQEKMEKWLADERLDYNNIQAFATPRRLAILIGGLADSQPDIEEEAKGPAKKIALDEAGNWSKAAQGFARGQGVATDQLFFKELKGVEYVYANRFIAGKKTRELLPALKELILSLHFPKNMRWGSHELRFARPIQWLVALYGTEVIPFEITGIETGTTTYGHRFLGKKIELKAPNDYEQALLAEYVISRPEERKQAIRSQLEEMAAEKNWVIPIDEDLLEEVHHLVEYPTALSGSFDEEFLALPKEVLITSMREHQRYFPVENQQGELLPYFVTVRNGDHKHLDNVARGNEKVLRARLADADFFYQEDQKVKIEDALKRLENIVYHEELGSIGDKVRRIQAGADKLLPALKTDSRTAEVTRRTAEICKFDLVTQMVYEFPELQGRMGEVYAELAGEEKEVAQAINEHYQPRFAGDASPATLSGTVVSIADKLDTVVTCFAIGLIPTGSQDPYALRRQAAGVVQMVSDHQLEVELEDLVDIALAVAGEQELLKRPYQELKEELVQFFALRVKAALQEKGVSYDVIDAVLTERIGHIPTLVNKALLIGEKHDQPDFKKVVEALSRVTNIAKKASGTEEISEEKFEKNEEKELYSSYLTVKSGVPQALAEGKVDYAYQLLADCEPVIHRYFDHIMVMADDEELKANRLAQMHAFAEVIRSFAHFQALVL
ncbi:glycine--tRNA ligase subunit beta [Alkalihalobacillus oceani]|uniref:glycine--tRNA ligase subunit beta n=1 Tax=Halalkalibacter oceani TaxID=1653776 RepID=UPI00203FD3A7|nr:glycine--tRNA ligase subunit beta [Halalkalibacter oceani]MCM3761493.1 glycine--tRNA ligase subunit beta [Halalkalibacter oceani]